MIPLEDNVLVKAGKPSEPKSMRLDNTPYLDIAEANAAWPQESRHQRLFMHLVDGLYWYKDGTLDTDLVPFVESIDLTYETLLILQSASTVVSQVPVEVDTPTTVLLGPAVTTNKGIDLEASGELVCTIAGTYTFYITAHFGRTGNSGIATVVAYSEFFIGGVWTPNAYSTYTKLDSTASIFPYSRDLAVTLAVGDRVRFRFLVNSGGATTAGLYNFDPTAPGVPTAETARIAVSKFAVNINGSALPIILDGVPEPTSGGNFLRTIGNWIEGVTKSLFDSTVTNIEAAIDLKATDITAGDGSKRYVRKNTTPQTWEELTTIPEPTSDGSWLRSKASTVYTWVLSVVFTQTEKDKLAKYPTAATNGKMLMGDGNNYVEVDAPSGGGIPEPTADGSWLRRKIGVAVDWVSYNFTGTIYYYVSPTGSDATAQPDDPSLPYRNIKTASIAASTKATATGKRVIIKVAKGDYNEVDIARDLCEYEFAEDATVWWAGTTGVSNAAIFGDGGNLTRRIWVRGLGRFFHLNYYPYSDRQAVAFGSSGSRIYEFECKELDGVQIYGNFKTRVAFKINILRFDVQHHQNQLLDFYNCTFKTGYRTGFFVGINTEVTLYSCKLQLPADNYTSLKQVLSSDGVAVLGNYTLIYESGVLDTTSLTPQQVVDTVQNDPTYSSLTAALELNQAINGNLGDNFTQFRLKVINCTLEVAKNSCIGIRVVQNATQPDSHIGHFIVQGCKVVDTSVNHNVTMESYIKLNSKTGIFPVSVTDTTMKVGASGARTISTTNPLYSNMSSEMPLLYGPVSDDMPTTIPEPTSDGSWLRSKASTVYTWVLSVVFTQTEKDKLAKYPTAATNGKMLMGDGNNYVEVDAPSGGGIPEPTADGSWLRSKASAVYSWVLSVIFTQVEKDKLAKYPTEATVGKVLVGNGTVYGEADVTVTNNTTVNITNTSGEYPIWYGFIKGLVETFTSTVTTSSWVWNGGVATNDTANGRLAITSVNNAKGAKIPFLHTAGMLVKLKLDITVPTGVVDVRDQYSNFIAKDLVTGIYYLEFTAQTTNPASFGRNVLLSSTTNSDFYINHVEIGYVDQANFVFTESEISRVNRQQFKAFENYLYQEDFRTKNTSNIGIYGTGTLNIDTILRTATVTFTSVGGNVFYIGYNSVTPIVIPTYSIITLEIVSLVNPILVQPNWGNGISETISTPGIYTFKFKKLVTNAIPQLNGYCLSSVSGLTNTIVLKNIKIENSYPDSLSASPTFQEAGYGASNLSKTGSIIGINTKGNMDTPLMLGNNSRGYFDNAFGGTTGPETTTIGNDALAASWRGTVLGAKSYNYAISATALGATTFVTRTHDVVLGRGAYGALKTNPANPNDSSVTTDPRHLYMGNGTAHMRNTPPSGIGCKGVDGSPITPSNTENIIHGQNAYDDRFPLWSSLTNYLAVSGWTYGGNTSWVRRVDTIYVAIANNINVDPLTDVPSTPDSNGFYIGTAWKKIYSVPPGETSQGQVAGDGTVAGGHIGLEAGTGTGGQHGGEVRFYTHKANAEGSNVPTTRKLIAKFISNNASNNTSFMLLDTTTNTWYSVNIGNTGTGPGGVGRALYVL